MKYLDFVDLKYEPKKDLICDFYLEADNIKRAAGAVAAESSIGTWTELSTMKANIEQLAAKVFSIKKSGKGAEIKIAYPAELFEPGSMPNILSSVAGNVFGMKELKTLRLLDIEFPEKLLKSFKGPKYGIKGIRKIFNLKRPLIGTIVKPKLGLSAGEHAKVAYEAWKGGCDIVKDDENLGNQKFNPFRERFLKTIKMRDRAESETGEKKIYMVNVTAEVSEMLKRAEFVEENGGEYIMVDVISVGWSGLQTLRQQGFNLVLHAHRAGHAAFTKSKRHGISMKVIAKIVRIVGCDQLHVGTAVGKMYEAKKEVLENIAVLKENNGLKPVFPVASGGLHPGSIPDILKIFGSDVIIQAGGGIHGNPLGTQAGAKAMRQALQATLEGISLKQYAEKHKELKAALNKWK